MAFLLSLRARYSLHNIAFPGSNIARYAHILAQLSRSSFHVSIWFLEVPQRNGLLGLQWFLLSLRLCFFLAWFWFIGKHEGRRCDYLISWRRAFFPWAVTSRNFMLGDDWERCICWDPERSSRSHNCSLVYSSYFLAHAIQYGEEVSYN